MNKAATIESTSQLVLEEPSVSESGVYWIADWGTGRGRRVHPRRMVHETPSSFGDTVALVLKGYSATGRRPSVCEVVPSSGGSPVHPYYDYDEAVPVGPRVSVKGRADKLREVISDYHRCLGCGFTVLVFNNSRLNGGMLKISLHVMVHLDRPKMWPVPASVRCMAIDINALLPVDMGKLDLQVCRVAMCHILIHTHVRSHTTIDNGGGCRTL